MSFPKLLALAVCGLTFGNVQLFGQTNEAKPKFTILKGPAKAALGSAAKIDLPAGYIFINGKDYQKILKAEGEPVEGNELGLLRATNEEWAIVFKFSDIGYVKDDDKDKLDADKLLASIRRGTEEANKMRIEAGNPAIEVIG